MNFSNLKVRFDDRICFVDFNRPGGNNTITDQLVVEFDALLDVCHESASIIVLSGSPEVFCVGADFDSLAAATKSGSPSQLGPGPLYDLWLKMATGPYITIAHVRGKVNAGGVGFVAASDIVVANPAATFSLSELLFGLYPACVLPFLIRRVGFQRAHYLTLTTQPINVQQASAWGLVDAVDEHTEASVRRHLARLRRISKTAVQRYKSFMTRIDSPLAQLKSTAVEGNLQVFTDPNNLRAIARYVEHGLFPWEHDSV